MSADQHSSTFTNDTLHEIIQGTFAETGEAFFDKLVKHLARAMGTRCAWVTEWLEHPRRLRALSFWYEDGYYGDYEYDIAGTPCESVIEERQLIHLPSRVIELHPNDPDLKPMGAVSYMGVPLLNTDDTILGHLAVMHDASLPEDPQAMAIFKIFAGRAAGELRRLHRDHALQEREQKLSRLIESAMDAIIELNEGFCVTNINDAAEKLFGCVSDQVIGTSFDAFLTAASRDKLIRLTGSLASQPEGKRSLWIPDGIEAMRATGELFPAEATMSHYALESRSYYALILRNINDRLDAEERIQSLMEEAASLRAEIDAFQGSDGIVGASDALHNVLHDVELVAPENTTVLITGETGTGKELIAAAIHKRSDRKAMPFIKVNCAAIPANLQESEFFGHEQGAFTGATQRRDGRFKLAHGGTLFLDEVGELSLDLQAKLLRVLQEGEFERVGGSSTEKVDVRIVAATNRDLKSMAEAGAFRDDLLYRLNVFPLHLPPLRERGEDMVLLAEEFARSLVARRGGVFSALPEEAKVRLKRYDWPGNIRELQNVIERAVITSVDGRTLNLDRALPEDATHDGESLREFTDTGCDEAQILTASDMRDLERRNIMRALEASHWKISGASGAAERLGLKANTLSSRMKVLGIARPG